MFNRALWSQEQLPTGVNRLSRAFGCELVVANSSSQTLEQYAETLGVEALATQSRYGDLQQTLRGLVPGIVAVSNKGSTAYLLISANRRDQFSLLLPAGGSCRCSLAELIEFIRSDRGYEPDPSIEQVLETLGLQGARLLHARQLLIYQQFEYYPVTDLWLLRPHANRGLTAAASHSRLWHYVLGFSAAHLAARGALIGGVSLLGYAIIQGVWTSAIVLTWLLVMLSHWAFSALGQSCQVQLDVRVGLIIKRQLQHSALRLPAAALASKGPAQLLSQAMEAEGLQNNALPGVFAAINAAIDMLIGLTIALLIQQWLISVLIVVFVLASSYPVLQFSRSYAIWAKRRTRLSHLTVEHMQGNRTRLIQSGPDRWHKEEERDLHIYWLASLRMDKFALWLQAIIPSLWLVTASAVLCVAIMFSLLPVTQLAVLLGVILLVWQAWHRMADSCQQLARSWYCWQEIQSLLKHNSHDQPNATQQCANVVQQTPAHLRVNQVSYYYAANRPVLQGINLHLQQGQQYLLQGESGSGKSTLLALLAGQVSPQQGWLLCNDRDLQTWGHQYWRKKICWVPQYHDNYLFSATLVFNLLLGRAWPPTPQEIKIATKVCDKLGLTPLLNKMPSGILQGVGEMGWQLSQGERSRVYLARALLQNPDFLLLDESLGALDAVTSLQILTSLQTEPSATLLCMHP